MANGTALTSKKGTPCAQPGVSLQKAYASTFGAALVIQLAGVLSGILSARLLGPEGRGLLVVVYLIPGLACAVRNLSLPMAVAYLISKREYETRSVTASAFWLSLAMAGLVFAILFLGLTFLSRNEYVFLPCSLRCWGWHGECKVWIQGQLRQSIMEVSCEGLEAGRQHVGHA